ncbi:MAG: NAD-dependent epimerase/dehydratase family protein, partial [Afipia sp.]|nr:NAD-dependent epimerase/dehydratase family protein [Afipia sp.]
VTWLPEMKVAVTGATGFIGRELLTRLVAAGHVAIPLVRREAGLPNERVVGDLAAGDEVRMDLRGVDAVVHLAGRAHVLRETAGDPLAEYRRINVGATERIAHASAAAGVRRVVMVSSIKVNGERTLPGTPFRFDDTPQPEDMYGRSKFEAEIAGREICGSVVGYTVIRPSMVYGFGARGNFERLVKLVRSGAPLPFGGLTNRRSMIHVGNLADLL